MTMSVFTLSPDKLFVEKDGDFCRTSRLKVANSDDCVSKYYLVDPHSVFPFGSVPKTQSAVT